MPAVSGLGTVPKPDMSEKGTVPKPDKPDIWKGLP